MVDAYSCHTQTCIQKQLISTLWSTIHNSKPNEHRISSVTIVFLNNNIQIQNK